MKYNSFEFINWDEKTDQQIPILKYFDKELNNSLKPIEYAHSDYEKEKLVEFVPENNISQLNFSWQFIIFKIVDNANIQLAEKNIQFIVVCLFPSSKEQNNEQIINRLFVDNDLNNLIKTLSGIDKTYFNNIDEAISFYKLYPTYIHPKTSNYNITIEQPQWRNI